MAARWARYRFCTLSLPRRRTRRWAPVSHAWAKVRSMRSPRSRRSFLPFGAPHPGAVLVKGFAGEHPALVREAALPLLRRCRNVRPILGPAKLEEQLHLVVALVGDHRDRLSRRAGGLPGRRPVVIVAAILRLARVAVFACGREVLARGFQARTQRRGVRLVRLVQLRRHHRARLDIDHVLGLVPEPGAAILQSHDARVGVGRRGPLLVGRLLPLALPIHLPRLFGRRRRHPLRLAQFLQVGGVVIARVLAHDRLHRRVRPQVGRIDARHLAAQETLRLHDPQHQPKHLVVHRTVEARAHPRQRRMIRHPLVHLHPEKRAQRERVRAPPLEPALRLDPFEVPHEEHPKVHARRDRRSTRLVVRLEGRRAQRLHPAVERGLLQQLVERLVKPMARRPRQRRTCNPHRRLLTAATSHRHAAHLIHRPPPRRYPSDMDSSTGC